MKIVHLSSFELLEEGLSKSATSDRVSMQDMPSAFKVFEKVLRHGHHGLISTSGQEWQVIK